MENTGKFDKFCMNKEILENWMFGIFSSINLRFII